MKLPTAELALVALGASNVAGFVSALLGNPAVQSAANALAAALLSLFGAWVIKRQRASRLLAPVEKKLEALELRVAPLVVEFGHVAVAAAVARSALAGTPTVPPPRAS